MKNKGIFNKILAFFSTIIAELIVILGVFFIVYACFMVNKILGFFILGGILFVFGIFLAKTRQ